MKTSWNRYLVWMLVWALMSTGSGWAGSRSSNLEAEALATQRSAVPPGVLYPPLPTNMSLPTYDYSDGETRAATQFTTGSANRARAFGVIWNSQSQTWELTAVAGCLHAIRRQNMDQPRMGSVPSVIRQTRHPRLRDSTMAR